MKIRTCLIARVILGNMVVTEEGSGYYYVLDDLYKNFSLATQPVLRDLHDYDHYKNCVQRNVGKVVFHSKLQQATP